MGQARGLQGTHNYWISILTVSFLCLDTVDLAVVRTKPQQTGHQELRTHDSHTSFNTSSDSHRLPGSAECPEGQYLRTLPTGQVQCTACRECPAGFGVVERCGRWTDVQCRPCERREEYRRVYFGVPKCFRCTRCENRPLIRACTATTDSICGRGCNPGYFLDELTSECVKCSYCYPEVPGYGVVEPMCQTKNQPAELTCLPSLPPRRFRPPTTTVQPTLASSGGSLEDKVLFLSQKIHVLEQYLLGELRQIRQDLNGLQHK